jgi:hypothetical protein
LLLGWILFFLVYDTPCHPPVVGHISSQLVWYKIFKTRNQSINLLFPLVL